MGFAATLATFVAITLATAGSAGAATAPGAGSSPIAAPSPTASPTAPQSPGVMFTATFDDGSTDRFVGDPSSVTVTPTTVAYRGTGAVAVDALTGYGQGARITLPAALSLPTGYFSASAVVRSTSGQVQDMHLVLVDSPAASQMQSVISRLSGSTWSGLQSFFQVASAGQPVSLRVEPIAQCSDAPAVPSPFLLDELSVTYYGSVPPPEPLYPTPTCPMGTTTPTVTPTVTPTATPTPTCRATFTVGTRWPGGYQATLTIQNLGPALNGWAVMWTMPSGEQLTQVWSVSTVVQSGTTVTVRNAPWNAVLAAGASLSLGMLGNQTGTDPVPPPSDVTLNGSPCQAVRPA